MSQITLPSELKPFHQVFQKFSHTHDAADVLDTFLEWMMWGFCSDGTLSWQSGNRFNEDQRPEFWAMFREYTAVMESKIQAHGDWYDLFGTYYEAYVASHSRRSCRGQFFTPAHVCDLMVKINHTNAGITGQTASDPTCGSGRLLLSYHANNIGNYVVGEDIDKTCCMMTACNLLIHGAVGEVVWHDSLIPNTWYQGWRINPNLNNPTHPHHGIPHIETLQQADSRIFQRWQAQATQSSQPAQPVQARQSQPQSPLKNSLSEYSQLTLF